MSQKHSRKEASPISEQFLHSLIELLPARIFAKDRAGRYIFANSAFVKNTTAAETKELIGKKPSDVLDKRRAERAESEDQSLLETGKPILERENLDYFGGEKPRWSLVSKVPVKNEAGEIEGMVGIAYDINARKVAEQKMEKLSTQLAQRNRQLEEDHELARRIHKSLSAPAPIRPDPDKRVRIETSVRQSSDLGGDLLRVEQEDNGDCLLILCDVMGHSVQAALISALLSGLIDRVLEETHDPGELLTNLNRRFLDTLHDRTDLIFATVICAHYNALTHEVTWASAGHPFPLLYRQAQHSVSSFPSHSSQGQGAIGVHVGIEYKPDVFKLEPGDRVLMITDGLIEAIASNGEELGTDWLAAAYKEMCSDGSVPSIDSLFSRLEKASPSFPEDDASVALLALD